MHHCSGLSNTKKLIRKKQTKKKTRNLSILEGLERKEAVEGALVNEPSHQFGSICLFKITIKIEGVILT